MADEQVRLADPGVVDKRMLDRPSAFEIEIDRRRAELAAQAGVAGSTTIEDDVMMAGQSGVIGHVRVGTGAVIGAKSAVLQPVDDGAFVTGIPAIAHADWRKSSALFGQLPSFRQRVAQLERRIAKLEETLGRWRKRKKRR